MWWNITEFSLMMQNIRKPSKNIEGELLKIIEMHEIDAEDYVSYLTSNTYGVTKERAKFFVGILIVYSQHGKERALQYFDALVNNWITKADFSAASSAHLLMEISSFCGALYANSVITKEESNSLSKKYTLIFQERITAALTTE